MSSSIRQALPASCEVTVPSPGDDLGSVLSNRWMQLADSRLPAAVVVPSSEEDVVAVVKYAAANGLRVIPTGGGLAAYVVVDEKTIYLKMEKFKDIQLGAGDDTVTVGGGATWSDVMLAVIPKGYYTGWTNFSGAGVVGSMLGGGFGGFFGLLGYACDQLVAARIVTASGEVVTVSAESTGDKRRLFNQLCGGGVGLGAVTSATLRLHRISTSLDLDDGNKVLGAVAMFPRAEWATAAAIFTGATPVRDRRMAIGLMLTNAPPNTPAAGEPVMMLSVSFVGRRADLERAAAPLFSPETAKKAVFVNTMASEVANMNAMADGRFHQVPGYSDVWNCETKEISAETILEAADRWLRFREEHSAEIVGKVYTIFAGLCNAAALEADPGGEKGLSHRDRAFHCQMVAHGTTLREHEILKGFAPEMLQLARRDDEAKGIGKATYANNCRVGTDVKEIYAPKKLEELRALKASWDPQGVFWNPAINSWA